MKSDLVDLRLRLNRQIAPITAILVVSIYFILTIWANTDLTAGRFVLFMDERIVFDGVKNILHPKSVRDFWYWISDGGDQRYGRSLWNLTAIAAFLPDRIWGDTGLIIAERMSQVVFLFLAMFLLCVTFVRNWWYRIVLLILLLAMPFSGYYMIQPKPEPIALASLALFLWLHKRREYTFGVHWLVLGISFGTKIAMLPAVMVLILATAITDANARGRRITVDELLTTITAFLAGVAGSVPFLLKPIIAMVAPYWIWRWYMRDSATDRSKVLIAICSTAAGLIAGHGRIDRWLDFTFRNTAHGADRASINALSWARYFYDIWLHGSPWLAVALGIAVFALVFLWVIQSVRKGRWRITPGVLLLTAGTALNSAIFLEAHRLWGFYLVPGTALILTGLVSLAETTLGEPEIPDRRVLTRFGHVVAYAVLLISLALALVHWVPNSFNTLKAAANRTENPGYKAERASFDHLTTFLDDYSKLRNKKLSVAFDPYLFPPEDCPRYSIEAFWGPYLNWTDRTDVLVFGKGHTPGARAEAADSPEYQKYLSERSQYATYVIEHGQRCTQRQCYERVALLPNGGEILVRTTGFEPGLHEHGAKRR